jgi:hypothetical protein
VFLAQARLRGFPTTAEADLAALATAAPGSPAQAALAVRASEKLVLRRCAGG